MAELVLRGRGESLWGFGVGLGRLPGVALQPKQLAGTRPRIVSPRARGYGDGDQRKQQIPKKKCAGLAALPLLSPQNLTLLPLYPGKSRLESGITIRYFLVRAGYSYFESLESFTPTQRENLK